MRGLPWLLGASALIGAGGWLMTQGDAGAAAHKQRDHLDFPTHQRSVEIAREAKRSTLLPTAGSPAAQGAVAAQGGTAAHARDPMLVALAPDAEVSLVFEASTILQAPVGQAMLGCLTPEKRERMDSHLKAQGKSWLDLAERVGVSASKGHEMFVIEGRLDGVDWEKAYPNLTRHEHGTAKVYDVVSDDGRWSWQAAIWGDELLIQSHDPATVEAAIDRLDAGGTGKLAFDESEAYGEVYGVVGPEAIAKLMPEDLQARAQETAKRAVIHVDATDEVLLVADVQGNDSKQVEDLGKSIGAAMAVGRLKAKSEDRDDVVRLLDQSKVRPFGDGTLRAEVAIPMEVMTAHMRGCAK